MADRIYFVEPWGKVVDCLRKHARKSDIWSGEIPLPCQPRKNHMFSTLLDSVIGFDASSLKDSSRTTEWRKQKRVQEIENLQIVTKFGDDVFQKSHDNCQQTLNVEPITTNSESTNNDDDYPMTQDDDYDAEDEDDSENEDHESEDSIIEEIEKMEENIQNNENLEKTEQTEELDEIDNGDDRENTTNFTPTQPSDISTNENNNPQLETFWKNMRNEKYEIPQKLLKTYCNDLRVLDLYLFLLHSLITHRLSESAIESFLSFENLQFPNAKLPKTFKTIKNNLAKMGLKIETLYVNNEGVLSLTKKEGYKEVLYFPISRAIRIIETFSDLNPMIFRSEEELKQKFDHGPWFHEHLNNSFPLIALQTGTDGLSVYNSVFSDVWPFIGRFLQKGQNERTIKNFFTIDITSNTAKPNQIDAILYPITDELLYLWKEGYKSKNGIIKVLFFSINYFFMDFVSKISEPFIGFCILGFSNSYQRRYGRKNHDISSIRCKSSIWMPLL